MEHTDDILSIAVSGDNHGAQLVATGEIGKSPTINVFDAKTMQTVVSLKGFHRRGVNQLAFSKDGDMLLSVGLDDDHSIAVYSTKDGKLIASTKGNKSKVLCAVGSSFKNGLFCTAGVKHVETWMVTAGSIKKSKVPWGKGGIQNGLCAAFTNEKTLVVGAAKGEIFVFHNSAFKSKVAAHDGSVNCLEIHPGGKIITGGKDGKVHLWESNLRGKMTVDMSAFAKAEVRVCESDLRKDTCTANTPTTFLT